MWAFEEFLGHDLEELYRNASSAAKVACPFAADFSSIGDAIPTETLAAMKETAQALPQVSVEEQTTTAARAATRELRELEGVRPVVPPTPKELADELNQAGLPHRVGWKIGSVIIPRLFPLILVGAGALAWVFLY
jgi:hypothetical protein